MTKIIIFLFTLLPTAFFIGCAAPLPDGSNTERVGIPLNVGETKANQGDQALFSAATTGNAKDIEGQLKAGTNVNIRDGWGATPLHWAARLNHEDAVNVLLEAGAGTLTSDDFGGTPLHWAARGGLAAVRALLEAGTDVNAQDNSGATPLHEAVGEGGLQVVKVLLQAGADVDARDKWSATPLHYVDKVEMVADTPALVRALLNAGANPKARDREGRRLLDLPKGKLVRVILREDDPETLQRLEQETDQ